MEVLGAETGGGGITCGAACVFEAKREKDQQTIEYLYTVFAYRR